MLIVTFDPKYTVQCSSVHLFSNGPVMFYYFSSSTSEYEEILIQCYCHGMETLTPHANKAWPI